MKPNESVLPLRSGALGPMPRRPVGSRVAGTMPVDDAREARVRVGATGAPAVPPTVLLRRATGVPVRGEHVSVLVDELGARLASERVGVRLYDVLLRRMERMPVLPDGITRASVEQLRREEAEHVTLVSDCIAELGSDPSAVTAAHDVYATACLGLSPRSQDPRSDFALCLEGVLRAEIADHDGWTVLVALARLLDRDSMVRRFERALATEKEHLRKVRRWARGSMCEAGPPSLRSERPLR